MAPFLRSELKSSSHLRPAAPGVAPMCPPSLARGRTLPSALSRVQHRTAHLDRWCCPGAAAAFDNTTAPLLPRRPHSMAPTEPLLQAEVGEAPARACAFKPGQRRNAAGKDAIASPDKQSIAASLATLVLTLPALRIIGITATAGAKNISHTFSLAFTLAILTNLAQFMAHKAAAKRTDLTHWQRYGPTYLLVISIPLVLADQVRHCLQDSGIWPEPGSSMYKDDCEAHTFIEHLGCLTPIGLLFSIAFTYTGFAFMTASILWSTNLPSKIHRAWSSISAGANDYDCGCDEP